MENKIDKKLLEQSKNQSSYVCLRSANLRKGKSVLELSNRDAMIIANREYKEALTKGLVTK